MLRELSSSPLSRKSRNLPFRGPVEPADPSHDLDPSQPLADQEDNEWFKLRFAVPDEIEYASKDRWFLCRFVLPPVAPVIDRRVRHSSGLSGLGDERRGA
jgi:hypothetical protein